MSIVPLIARENPCSRCRPRPLSLDASAHADAVVLDQQVIVIALARERDEDETPAAGPGNAYLSEFVTSSLMMSPSGTAAVSEMS